MLKEIKERQSVRKFLVKPVCKNDLEELLRAAMQSPTSHNGRSWKFLAITNKKVLCDIAEFSEYTQMLKAAPCAIVVMADTDVTQKEYSYFDASAATMNILLEAVHLGLGAVWCGLGPSENKIGRYRKYFDLEDHLIPVSVIPIGYPANQRPFIDRYDETKVTWYE